MPPIVVTARDGRVSSRHRQHAEEKIAKLQRYFDGILKIEVTLGHDRSSAGGAGGAEAEVVLSVRGGKPVVCHSRQDDLRAAIDTVLDKAEVQLTRHKEKLKGHKGAPSSRRPDESPSAAGQGDQDYGSDDPSDQDEPSYQDIVEEREFPPAGDDVVDGEGS